jgi:hypothetical protein
VVPFAPTTQEERKEFSFSPRASWSRSLKVVVIVVIVLVAMLVKLSNISLILSFGATLTLYDLNICLSKWFGMFRMLLVLVVTSVTDVEVTP